MKNSYKMVSKEVMRDIKGGLGALVNEVEFEHKDGLLYMNRVPSMAMGALERFVRPLGVFVVNDRDTELDVIVNDGMTREVLSMVL